jgi:uncharacterized protein (TIGR00251 family)
MEVSEIIRQADGGCELDVLVSPRSNRSGPEGVDEWRKMLILRVRAPPLDGRANKEVESTLSEITGYRCQVIRGQTSRQKTVLICGPSEEVLRKLGST